MNRFKISTLVFLFSLLMSSRVFSQTNYDFSAYLTTGDVFSARFTTGIDTPSTFTSVTNAFYDGLAIDVTTISPGSNGYGIFPTSVVYGSINLSNQHISVLNLSFASTLNSSQTIQLYQCASASSGAQCPIDHNGYYSNYFTFQNISTGSVVGLTKSMYSIDGVPFWDSSRGGVIGAPEIDGSLAPKVGFLLGCLFLMFGRKKQESIKVLV